MRITSLLAPLLAALTLTACGPVKMPDFSAMLAGMEMPAMRWDARPEAAEWTRATLIAVAEHDDVLASRVPADIAAWCPGYKKASMMERRSFWAGLLSAVSKYESSYNPNASGGGGRYIGLLQISPRSAAQHNCTATSAKALKNGVANLQCGVEIIAHAVGSDGVVAGKGNRGAGRDWGPFSKAKYRNEMSAWTSSQSYCQ
jgi:hypothetical protein